MSQFLWQRLTCYLTGHDYSVRSDRQRMYLRCDTCGHTSEGWALTRDQRLGVAPPPHVPVIRRGASSESPHLAAR